MYLTNKTTLCIIILSYTLLLSCNKSTPETPIHPKNQNEQTEQTQDKDNVTESDSEIADKAIPPATLSKYYSNLPNNAELLKGNESEKVSKILNITSEQNKDALHSLYYDDVTEAELKEIQELTDSIINEYAKGKNLSETEKYHEIFKWIVTNIKYGWVPASNGIDSNRPAQVLKNKKCVCQGYANLLKVMCYTQDIGVITANGGCYHNNRWLGDHAWNYVYVDKTWIVSDPTWHRDFNMKNEFEKHSKVLKPTRLAIKLFSCTQFEVGYKNFEISLIRITKDAPADFFIPYSWDKYIITSLDVDNEIPANVESLYISKNIISFGDIKNNGSGFINSNYGKRLNHIYIKSDNPKFEADGGVIYDKTAPQSNAMPIIVMDYSVDAKLKYGKAFGKNIIVNKPNLASLFFPDSAEQIEDYAVENCPNLKKISIPKGCKISSNAFYKCNKDCKIEKRP